MSKKWQSTIMKLFNSFSLATLRQIKKYLLPFVSFIITLSIILFGNHHTVPPAQSQVTVAGINKSFSPSTVNPGEVSSLSVSLFNSSAAPLT
ncbi:MAG: hypothetical protein ACK6C7_00825, partial [Pseudanabaena sp.]